MSVNYIVAVAMGHIAVEDNCLMILCKCANEPKFPFFFGPLITKSQCYFESNAT